MKKFKIILLAGLFSVTLNQKTLKAQFVEDFRAKAVLEKQYTDVKGSPYLMDDWATGIVKLENGSTYKDIPLKYDQVSGDLLFKDGSGRTMVFADPVKEFKFTDNENGERLLRSGFKPVDVNTNQTFYLVLYEGGTVLLKDLKKNMVQHRPYNSASTVKSIVETPAYYLVLNGELVKFKKDKKSIISVLNSAAIQLEKYMKDNDLNLKEDKDLAKLISYYDSIKSTG